MTPQILVLSMAGKTTTAVVPATSILTVVWMALRTMCLTTVSFAIKTASLILSIGDDFKVLRIDAMPNAAKVIELHTVRDWPNKPFITQAVSLLKHVGRNLEMTITINCGCSPQPASSCFLNLRPEAGLCWHGMVAVRHGNYIVTHSEGMCKGGVPSQLQP